MVSEKRHIADVASWGCLGAGMILLGAFTVYLFEIVGGTDYEIKYMAAASIAGGVGILIMLAIHFWSDRRRLRLPRLNPLIVFAALAVIFVLLFF